ncbi:lymphocyte antigen 6I isoform X2 [Folsomia candida]|uniref:lymphocyte antigen 6I isoform X2 n=1 Tax=Folsomia candida TaxID=158441 RepID=UPI001604D4C5|nr:lymphocyte antigen 6I isoform X2 [Folsomia candida]
MEEWLGFGGVGTLSVVEGIRCYQCGTYIITSVTPCRNLSSTHLHECPPEAQFCSKYSNPAIQVYGCEKHCEERVQNSFEIHCCGEDKCNGAEITRGSSWIFLLAIPATWYMML